MSTVLIQIGPKPGPVDADVEEEGELGDDGTIFVWKTDDLITMCSCNASDDNPY